MLRRRFLSRLAYSFRKTPMDRARSILDDAVGKGEVSYAVMQAVQGSNAITWALGKARPETPFLLASITKPMTATGVMVLAGRKQLSLADPVRKFIPEFRGGDRGRITIRHLLTHTSGLPDMLPENQELRRRHAGLKDFTAAACKTPLLFSPGAKVQYQSMGILLAAEICERIARTPFRDFLREHVFRPLNMNGTSLGLGGRSIGDTAISQVSGNEDWNWNSPYWRDLGAPWGGAHAPAADVIRFLQYFLDPDDRVLKPEAARRMTANQNQGLNEPWGIGFLVNGAKFGKSCPAGTFGHWGSTGTLAWADPGTKTAFVLLTTKPASSSRDSVLGPVSDAVSEAVLEVAA